MSWIEPAWFAAGAAGVGATSAAVATVTGVRTLRQTRRDSKNRSRPMVSAELESVPYVRGSQKLVVKNHGPSIARDVVVSFDPPIPDPTPEKAAQSVTPFLKRRYGKTIPVMTPGASLENIYYSGRAGPDGQYVNYEPTPDQVLVKITYTDSNGTPYEDAFPLDVMLIRETTEVTSSAAPEAKIKEMAQELKRIREVLTKQLKAANPNTGETTPPQAVKDLLDELKGNGTQQDSKDDLQTRRKQAR